MDSVRYKVRLQHNGKMGMAKVDDEFDEVLYFDDYERATSYYDTVKYKHYRVDIVECGEEESKLIGGSCNIAYEKGDK